MELLSTQEMKPRPAVFSIQSKPVDLEAKVLHPPGLWWGAVINPEQEGGLLQASLGFAEVREPKWA